MGKAIDTDIIRVDASEPPYIPPQYPDRRCGDTDYWAEYPDFVPGEGEFIVYSDYHQVEVEGALVDVPGIKIGDGVSTISELPFITAYEDAHLDESSIFWTTYGETTYGEIMQASSQEKKVCCKYNSNIYDLVYAGSYCLFACADNIVSPAIVRFLRVETSGSWSSTDTGALATAAFIAMAYFTSFADIKAALDAGREVLCLGPGGYGHLAEKTSNYIVFATLPNSGYNGASRKFTVNNTNNWADSFVGFNLEYDTVNKKLQKTYGSTYIDVVTAEKIVEDGVATANLISQEDFDAIFSDRATQFNSSFSQSFN